MTQINKCLNCGKDYDFDTQGAICPHESGDRRLDSLNPWPVKGASTMGDVKRYDPDFTGMMHRHPEGEWVNYEDYAALQREIAELRAPVTDEEAAIVHKAMLVDRTHRTAKETLTQVISARASAQGEKGNGNGSD